MKKQPGVFILILVFASCAAMAQGSLTYQIQGGWSAASSSVEYSGTVTFGADVVANPNPNGFNLAGWDVVVDINSGEIVRSFNSDHAGEGPIAGGMLLGINPASLYFRDADYSSFSLTFGAENGDPNMPWLFAFRNVPKFGVVEGDLGTFPDDINDHVIPLNADSQMTLVPEPQPIALLVLGALPLLILAKRVFLKCNS